MRSLLCFLIAPLLAAQPARLRDTPLSLSVSVLIPCTSHHFPYLQNLLVSLTTQTHLPDEISISLSDCRWIDPEQIQALEEKVWPFDVKIERHNFGKSAGENRNFARMQSTGDLLICQDADDIPHPQRIEIVKRIFEFYEVEYLIHSWAPGGIFIEYDLLNPELIPCTDQEIFEGYQKEGKTIPLHNGNICLIRELAERNRWDPLRLGEDIRFNLRAIKMTRRAYLTPMGLIHFVEGRSHF